MKAIKLVLILVITTMLIVGCGVAPTAQQSQVQVVEQPIVDKATTQTYLVGEKLYEVTKDNGWDRTYLVFTGYNSDNFITFSSIHYQYIGNGAVENAIVHHYKVPKEGNLEFNMLNRHFEVKALNPDENEIEIEIGPIK